MLDKDHDADGPGVPPLGVGARHDLGRQLHLAAKGARAYLEQLLATQGSSFATWTALFALDTGGSVIQRELAEMLSVEGPTLTRHLARMEAEGLIVRRRTAADRRAALVELTDHGRAVKERLSEIVIESSKQVLAGFSPDEVEQFGGFLARLIQNVDPSNPARQATMRERQSR